MPEHTLAFKDEYISLNGRTNTIGIGPTEFTDSDTRYVCVTPSQLRDWAETVQEAAEGEQSHVYVGVTPGKPLVAKGAKDNEISIQLSPRIPPGEME